jgi:hypothetical protein
MPRKKTETADLKVTFPCPGCKVKCSAGYGDSEGVKVPMILHAVPYCEYFLKSDVLKILEDANKQN